MTELATGAEASDQTPMDDTSNVQAEDNLSLGDNIDNAFKAIDEAAEDKTPPTGDNPPKAEDKQAEEGDEAAQEADKQEEVADSNPAPERFSKPAQDAWKDAPAAVQLEANRAINELTAGIDKHKAELAEYDGLQEFKELAEKSNTTMEAAAKQYVGLENLLQENPIAGLQKICSNLGMTLEQVAAHVTRQPVNVQQHQSAQTIAALQTEINTLKSQIEGIDGTISQNQANEMQAELDAFKADKPHFETVRQDMSMLMQNERAEDLQSAYDLAVKMRGLADPKPSVEEEKQKETDLKAQTQKGKLSVVGAPAAGSNPDKRRPAKSARESLDRAFATMD